MPQVNSQSCQGPENMREMKFDLKVESCKLCNNKYVIASTQISTTEIFTFIVLQDFKLWSPKVLFMNRKDNGNC